MPVNDYIRNCLISELTFTLTHSLFSNLFTCTRVVVTTSNDQLPPTDLLTLHFPSIHTSLMLLSKLHRVPSITSPLGYKDLLTLQSSSHGSRSAITNREHWKLIEYIFFFCYMYTHTLILKKHVAV